MLNCSMYFFNMQCLLYKCGLISSDCSYCIPNSIPINLLHTQMWTPMEKAETMHRLLVSFKCLRTVDYI